MKKTYIIPTLEVVRMKSQQLLAGSLNAPLSNDTQANEEALSRELFLIGD